MREILFRGKRLDTKKWMTGYYYYDENNEEHLMISAGGTFQKICSETVGQYTGLVDKNGVRIFEGDILLFKDPIRGFDPNRDYTCQVVWQDNAAMFDGKGYVEYRDGREMKQKIDHMLPPNLFRFDGAVIGNIHDHPELLEKGK